MRRIRVALSLLAGFAAAAVVLASGCQKPLFAKDEPRTQFETYDIMRQRYIPTERPDVFGNPQPALRARLTDW